MYILILLFNLYFFIYKNKYKIIIEKYEQEPENDLKLKNYFSQFYITISIVSPFVIEAIIHK